MKLAGYIDYTNLKAICTINDIRKMCEEAKEFNFHSIFIPSMYITDALKLLDGSKVKVGSVAGFPYGFQNTLIKLKEAEEAISYGANEIDFVMNIGKFKNKDYDYVFKEMTEFVRLNDKIIWKVIIETCYLNDEEKIKACRMVSESGAHFIKTSTGIGPVGATISDVRLLKACAQGKIKVKASGGIKNAESAIAFIEAGADRIGTSSGVEIMQGLQ